MPARLQVDAGALTATRPLYARKAALALRVTSELTELFIWQAGIWECELVPARLQVDAGALTPTRPLYARKRRSHTG